MSVATAAAAAEESTCMQLIKTKSGRQENINSGYRLCETKELDFRNGIVDDKEIYILKGWCIITAIDETSKP